MSCIGAAAAFRGVFACVVTGGVEALDDVASSLSMADLGGGVGERDILNF